MPISDAVSAELRAKHKKCVKITDPDTGAEYVFRKPKRSEWNLCQRTVGDDRIGAAERLAKECLVFPELNGSPDVEKFDDFLEEQPASLTVSIFPALIELAGGALEAGKV